MPIMTVSVTMSSFMRHPQLRDTLETYLVQTRRPDEIIIVEDGYDQGATKGVCDEFSDRGLPMKWLCRRNRPNLNFSNAAIPRNIGIRAATGEVLIIANPEVKFTKPTDFENIVGPVEAAGEAGKLSCCAPCLAFNRDGSERGWYADPRCDGNFSHFCQAYRRLDVVAIGGFDERFQLYGYEDHDFNSRLYHSGVRTVWAENVVVYHMWHEQVGNPPEISAYWEKQNAAMAGENMRAFFAGERTVEVNVGKAWGNIDD
jgi:GT2 family glycosyltransferase